MSVYDIETLVCPLFDPAGPHHMVSVSRGGRARPWKQERQGEHCIVDVGIDGVVDCYECNCGAGFSWDDTERVKIA